jgi:hypothetical protein
VTPGEQPSLRCTRSSDRTGVFIATTEDLYEDLDHDTPKTCIGVEAWMFEM